MLCGADSSPLQFFPCGDWEEGGREELKRGGGKGAGRREGIRMDLTTK
jgi:hypothetical protein